MKRIISVVVLAAILSLCCSSCSDSSSGTDYYTDDSGNFVIESDGRTSVMASKLPVAVPYNDNSFYLADVNFYENCVNFSYNLFIVITLDVSNLSDAELHWLRESDLDVSAYITCEPNGYDFDRALTLGNLLLTDAKQLIFVKTSSFLRENRKSFSNADISVSVNVEQESGSLEAATFHATLDDALADAETIEEPLYGYVADWLYEESQEYAQRIN